MPAPDQVLLRATAALILMGGAYTVAAQNPQPTAFVPEKNLCAARMEAVAVGSVQWNGWGRDLSNTRYQPEPGLKAADVPRLKLKWSFVYPGGVNSLPAIVGG